MTDKTPIPSLDLSVLRADPEATETKDVRGIPFEFRTRLSAKVIRDMDMNPDSNPEWENDLQRAIIKSPILTTDDLDNMDAKTYAEIIVECLDIAGLNARPTFR